MSEPFMVGGLRVVENPLLYEPGEPYEARRTLRERLFTRPWRPLRRTKMVTPQLPASHVYRAGDKIIAHPEKAAELRRLLAARAAQWGDS